MNVMKFPKLKSVLLFAAFIALSYTSVRAQTEKATFVDTSGHVYGVIAAPWRTFHDVGRKGLDIPIDAFAGADTFGFPVAGFCSEFGFCFCVRDSFFCCDGFYFLRSTGEFINGRAVNA